LKAEFAVAVLETGLTPEAYRIVMEKSAGLDPTDFEGLEAERVAFAELNLKRTERLQRHWRPSEALASLMGRLDHPQLWMVLTEPWCGDSAHCLPCLEILAESSPLVTIRFLTRDDHLDIMDRYLTDGKRSIPILVALDPQGDELFRWGPRPAEAQAVFDQAAAEGLDKPAKLERLHLFYGRNRGRALDEEMIAVITNFLDGIS